MLSHKDFFVIVHRRAPSPKPWRWEIYRQGRKSPIEFSKIFFETTSEANRAGERGARIAGEANIPTEKAAFVRVAIFARLLEIGRAQRLVTVRATEGFQGPAPRPLSQRRWGWRKKVRPKAIEIDLTVICDGKVAVDDWRLVTMDEQEISRTCQNSREAHLLSPSLASPL
jgi:hypothetical protein